MLDVRLVDTHLFIMNMWMNEYNTERKRVTHGSLRTEGVMRQGL